MAETLDQLDLKVLILFTPKRRLQLFPPPKGVALRATTLRIEIRGNEINALAE